MTRKTGEIQGQRARDQAGRRARRTSGSACNGDDEDNVEYVASERERLPQMEGHDEEFMSISVNEIVQCDERRAMGGGEAGEEAEGVVDQMFHRSSS